MACSTSLHLTGFHIHSKHHGERWRFSLKAVMATTSTSGPCVLMKEGQCFQPGLHYYFPSCCPRGTVPSRFCLYGGFEVYTRPFIKHPPHPATYFLAGRLFKMAGFLSSCFASSKLDCPPQSPPRQRIETWVSLLHWYLNKEQLKNWHKKQKLFNRYCHYRIAYGVKRSSLLSSRAETDIFDCTGQQEMLMLNLSSCVRSRVAVQNKPMNR